MMCNATSERFQKWPTILYPNSQNEHQLSFLVKDLVFKPTTILKSITLLIMQTKPKYNVTMQVREDMLNLLIEQSIARFTN